MCDCFTCANSDDLESVKGYLLGVYDAYNQIMNCLEESGIKEGSLTSPTDSKEYFYGYVKCNLGDTFCYLNSDEFMNVHILNAKTNKAYLLGCLESFVRFKNISGNIKKLPKKVKETIKERLSDVVGKLKMKEFRFIRFKGTEINELENEYVK